MPRPYQLAADEYLRTEAPFTRKYDALDESMTWDDAAWLGYAREDIATATTLEQLDAIERKASYESPIVRYAVRHPLTAKRKDLTT